MPCNRKSLTSLVVQIGGSGTTNPPTVKLPGAYSASDPVRTRHTFSRFVYADRFGCWHVGHPHQYLHSAQRLQDPRTCTVRHSRANRRHHCLADQGDLEHRVTAIDCPLKPYQGKRRTAPSRVDNR